MAESYCLKAASGTHDPAGGPAGGAGPPAGPTDSNSMLIGKMIGTPGPGPDSFLPAPPQRSLSLAGNRANPPVSPAAAAGPGPVTGTFTTA